MLSISIAVCILCSTLAVVYCYVLLFKRHPFLLHHATSSLYFTCILVLTHYASEGKYQGGGDLLFTSTNGCIQSTPTMANSLTMDYLPFANVADNVLLDRNRLLNIYRDINNLP